MNNKMVLMNSWNIEQHSASVGDDFDAKINSFKHIKWFLCYFGKLNSTEQVGDDLMLK